MKDVDQLLGIQQPTVKREKIKQDSVEVQKTKEALLLRNVGHHNAIVTSPEKNDNYKLLQITKKHAKIAFLG